MAEKTAQRDDDAFIATAPVRAQLFGEFRLYAPDKTIVPLANRRARALLAMLCIDSAEPLARDSVAKLLWPGRFEAQAKASLRQCLLDLGRILAAANCDILAVSRDRIRLNPGMVRSDLGDLEQALAVGDLDLLGSLLHQIESRTLVDEMQLGAAFDQWIATRRSATEQRLTISIADTVDRLRRAGNMASADRLRDVWGIRHVPAAAAPSAQLDRRVRIAILPFKAIGVDPGSDYFADGIVDELISTFGQLPQILAAGRTSSFHFRDSPLPLPEVSRALGVSYLIEGSVQRQGDHVRIHTHLIDGTTGFELWGQRFDGTLDSIFALQENVAQAVTQALAKAVNVDIALPHVRNMTASKEAFDLYLQGRSLNARLFGNGVLDKAAALLGQAVAIDPQFAEAWVELAEVHHNISVWTQCLDRNAEALRMAECAHKAIVLAPQLGYPRALLAIYEWTRNNVVGAMDLVFEAYRRQPTHPGVAMRVGSFLLFLGRTSDAAPYVLAAIEQDPVDTRKYALLIAVHMGRGEFEAAVQVGQRSVDLGFPSVQLALALAATGQNNLAVEQYQLTKKLVNTFILPPVGSGPMTDEAMDAYWLVAAKGVCSGQEADRLIYHQLLNMMFATLHDKADMAIIAPSIMTGHVELVFKGLGLSLTPANMVWLAMLWIDIDPVRQIWQHPEFIPFAQRIGMTAAWEKYGWPDILPVPSNRA